MFIHIVSFFLSFIWEHKYMQHHGEFLHFFIKSLPLSG